MTEEVDVSKLTLSEGYAIGSYYAGIGLALKEHLQFSETCILNIIMTLINTNAEDNPKSQTSLIGFNTGDTEDDLLDDE